MKHILLLLALAFIQTSCSGRQTQDNINQSDASVQVLLIGSSHWNNYQSKGLDVAQTNEVDILSDQYQKELDQIVAKIKEFKPDKIFVERTVAYQPKLDSLYKLYKTTDWGQKRRNEIFQLGFKVAKELQHKKVYGVDYRGTQFPFDSLINAMKQAKQTTLIESFTKDIKKFEKEYNALISKKKPLKDIFYYLNNKNQRKLNFGWYLNGANKGGTIDNNTGSFLASEWIRRNLYIYSSIQKYTEPKDKRIMVLMGAGHIAVLENLISYSPDWKIVELKDIMQ